MTRRAPYRVRNRAVGIDIAAVPTNNTVGAAETAVTGAPIPSAISGASTETG